MVMRIWSAEGSSNPVFAAGASLAHWDVERAMPCLGTTDPGPSSQPPFQAQAPLENQVPGLHSGGRRWTSWGFHQTERGPRHARTCIAMECRFPTFTWKPRCCSIAGGGLPPRSITPVALEACSVRGWERDCGVRRNARRCARHGARDTALARRCGIVLLQDWADPGSGPFRARVSDRGHYGALHSWYM